MMLSINASCVQLISTPFTEYSTFNKINFKFGSESARGHFIVHMSARGIHMKRRHFTNVVPENRNQWNKKIMCSLLMALVAHDDSLKSIIGDLCDFLKIDRSLSVTIDQLVVMSVTDACEGAVKVQSCGFNSLIFQLIKYYFKKLCDGDESVTPQQLCDLIDSVDPKNEYHVQALDIKFKMLLGQDQTSMTPDEKIWTKQMLFDTAFKKGDVELLFRIILTLFHNIYEHPHNIRI